MEINVGKNIKKLRKDRSMTQEQLAEVLRVTVGAVYKWENSVSMPEISKLVEMAELFEVSVDYLLDYRVVRSGVDEAIEKISRLRSERRFVESIREAEKALQKYPNHFDIVFESAQTYFLIMRKEKRFALRCIELLERACLLFEQNSDDKITLKVIRQAIANCYIGTNQFEKSVELLKELNTDDSQNDMIGLVLSVFCHKPEEAMPYLTAGLYENLISVFRSVIGFSIAYMQTGCAGESFAVVSWMLAVLKGLRVSDGTSFLDKLEVVLLALLAGSSMRMGDQDAARRNLIEALNQARRFDAAPEYRTSVGFRFFHGEPTQVGIDDLGDTALLSVENMLALIDDNQMTHLWEEINNEKN